MRNINDFVTRPPTLDRYEIRRTKLAAHPTPVWEVVITGWCTRKKQALFVHVETVTEADGPMKLSDIIHHLALVCEQDKPVTIAQMERGLLGEHWDQPELPGM